MSAPSDGARADARKRLAAVEGFDLAEQFADVIGKHATAEDWHCTCGEDLFGGSAAYSYELYRFHVAAKLIAVLP